MHRRPPGNEPGEILLLHPGIYMKQNALLFTLLLRQLRIFGHCADEAEHTVANLMLFTRLITKRIETPNFHSTFSYKYTFFVYRYILFMNAIQLTAL